MIELRDLTMSVNGYSSYPYGQHITAVIGLFVPRKGRAMEKGLCYGALGVAALMLLLFLLDMIAAVPFGGSPFVVVDVFGLIASGIVGYLAWNASRDLK